MQNELMDWALANIKTWPGSKKEANKLELSGHEWRTDDAGEMYITCLSGPYALTYDMWAERKGAIQEESDIVHGVFDILIREEVDIHVKQVMAVMQAMDKVCDIKIKGEQS